MSAAAGAPPPPGSASAIRNYVQGYVGTANNANVYWFQVFKVCSRGSYLAKLLE